MFLPSRLSARFYASHAGVPLGLALVLYALFARFDIDRWVSDFFYDTGTHAFGLRGSWAVDALMHHFAEYLVVLVAVGALAGLVLSFVWSELRALRIRLLFVSLVLMLAPVGARALSGAAPAYCPDELAQYGGFASPSLGPRLAPATGTAHCGLDRHAAAGFGLVAFYFCWRRRRWLAGAALASACGCGLLIGESRVVQGEAFLSQVLWTGIAVWLAALVLYRVLLFPGDERRASRNLPRGAVGAGLEGG
jgi:membrane-associated PAP2 superfamily phosphatase